MKQKYLILLLLTAMLSCSKKHHLQKANTDANGNPIVIKHKPINHGPLPKTIDVPDKAASKDIDGRLYFDHDGHRYWKNYVDGKYYLFNKGMYNDPAFKPR